MPPSLGPRLTEVVLYLQRERAELVAYVQSLPGSSLSQRPSANSWSVAETLEHLVKIESGAGRLISTLLKQVIAEGNTTQEETSIMHKLDQFFAGEGSQKLEAPDFVKPTGVVSASDSLEALETIRGRVIEAIEKSAGWDLGSVSYSHPFFGPITGYQWMLLIGKHEERHLKQIKEAARQNSQGPTQGHQGTVC
ncbi:MAG: DinB family protein [Gemmatimonadota bacterium]|nr:DinB family protein [Gemmatimonadota bacterium]